MSTRPVVDSLMPLDWNMAAKTRFLADRMLTWPPTLLPPSPKQNWTSQNDWLRNKFLNCRRILSPVEHSWIGLHFIQNKHSNGGDCELLSRLAWNLPDFPRFPFVELRVFLQLDFITSIYIGKYIQDLVTIIRSRQSSNSFAIFGCSRIAAGLCHIEKNFDFGSVMRRKLCRHEASKSNNMFWKSFSWNFSVVLALFAVESATIHSIIAMFASFRHFAGIFELFFTFYLYDREISTFIWTWDNCAVVQKPIRSSNRGSNPFPVPSSASRRGLVRTRNWQQNKRVQRNARNGVGVS